MIFKENKKITDITKKIQKPIKFAEFENNESLENFTKTTFQEFQLIEKIDFEKRAKKSNG